MNLFKKALVASAVVASFGASATATLSSTPAQLSAEGVADGIVATNQNITFDVVVGTLHPAASTITLEFDATVDLDGLTGGAVTNTPANGTGTAGNVTFDYGTGSFTFDNVVITDNDQTKGEKDTISFDINLGNPLTADSAFRITLGDNVVDLSGAANVAYSAVTSGGDDIETGSGVVAEEVSQFAFSVETALDKLIDRDDLTQYTDTTATDTLSVTLSNDETLLAAMTAVSSILTISGDFTGVPAADMDAEIATVDLVAAEAINGDEDEITITLSAAEVVDNGDTDLDIIFTHAAGDIPATGDVTVDVELDFTNGTAVAFDYKLGVAAGEWAIDATIINVPYFPVGFEGTSTSVHLSNEGASDVDVIVTAIDNNGNTYGPLDLGMDLPGDTVTKVSQTAIMSLFGLTESTKLSVTFNLDANDGVVNGYAFTSSEVGRTEISNSQLKGK
jgi:hypothetical protein